jgi:hypothetical protein
MKISQLVHESRGVDRQPNVTLQRAYPSVLCATLDDGAHKRTQDIPQEVCFPFSFTLSETKGRLLP